MVTTFHSSVSLHYHSGSDRQECGGACSTSFPRLLQPSLRRVEDLGVLETCHRSLDPQSFCGCVTFSDGDHPVGSSVCSSGQLDGLHQPQGIVLAGTCPSGLSPLPSVCGTGQGVPVHCSLLWSLHGSAGLHTGHGSCIRNSPFLGYPHAAVPGRLACPVVLSRFSAPQPSGGSGSLSRARHCCQPSQVTLRTFSGASVSRGGHRHPVFQGFFIAGSRRQAAVNGWCISILRRSASHNWLSLLGMLSSLSHLVPGGRLRVRSLQICLPGLGIGWISPPGSPGRRTASAISSGGFTFPVLRPGCHCSKCLRIWTSGPTPPTWVGVLT